MIAVGGGALSHGSGRVHEPVLVQAVLEALRGEREAAQLEGWVVDATLGAGGHTRAILETFPGVRVLGIDPDPEVLDVARETLVSAAERVRVERGRFSRLDEILAEAGVADPLGILFDLGANSLHFDRPERGFSFQHDGPLDMRMDPELERTAADVINHWDEADLADLFYYEGGERHSRRIADAICRSRRRAPFLRTIALAELIASVSGKRDARIHPATRCFQALRRAVNDEGEELLAGLEAARRVLPAGGRLCVITFHSGEDGEVKRFLAAGSRAGQWNLVTRRPVEPGPEERSRNPRARSARLRCAERTGEPAEAVDPSREERA